MKTGRLGERDKNLGSMKYYLIEMSVKSEGVQTYKKEKDTVRTKIKMKKEYTIIFQ